MLDSMNGVRRWPPIDSKTGKQNPDVSLFYFLTEVIRSKVSHVWQRERRRVSIDSNDESEFDGFDRGLIDRLLSDSAEIHPEFFRYDHTESDAAYNQTTARMLEIVAHDKEMYRIAKLWRDQPNLKPRELAKCLDLTMPQVRAAQKRLRRILKDEWRKWQ